MPRDPKIPVDHDDEINSNPEVPQDELEEIERLEKEELEGPSAAEQQRAQRVQALEAKKAQLKATKAANKDPQATLPGVGSPRTLTPQFKRRVLRKKEPPLLGHIELAPVEELLEKLRIIRKVDKLADDLISIIKFSHEVTTEVLKNYQEMKAETKLITINELKLDQLNYLNPTDSSNSSRYNEVLKYFEKEISDSKNASEISEKCAHTLGEEDYNVVLLIILDTMMQKKGKDLGCNPPSLIQNISEAANLHLNAKNTAEKQTKSKPS